MSQVKCIIYQQILFLPITKHLKSSQNITFHILQCESLKQILFLLASIISIFLLSSNNTHINKYFLHAQTLVVNYVSCGCWWYLPVQPFKMFKQEHISIQMNRINYLKKEKKKKKKKKENMLSVFP